MAPSVIQVRKSRGNGRRNAIATIANERPATKARRAANDRCGAYANPKVIRGKHNAFRRATKINIGTSHGVAGVDSCSAERLLCMASAPTARAIAEGLVLELRRFPCCSVSWLCRRRGRTRVVTPKLHCIFANRSSTAVLDLLGHVSPGPRSSRCLFQKRCEDRSLHSKDICRASALGQILERAKNFIVLGKNGTSLLAPCFGINALKIGSKRLQTP